MKKKELKILISPKRSIIKYEIAEFIFSNHKCTVSEIEAKIDVNSRTLYRYIDQLVDKGVIYKSFRKIDQKNGSRFVIIVNSELEGILEESRAFIKEFFSRYQRIFDNIKH
jgi:predicted transcriptional regulator